MDTKLCKGLPRIDTAGLKSFIPENTIYTLLQGHAPDKFEVRDILAKSLSKTRLNPNEMAALLLTKDPELVEEITSSAAALKKEIYGNRIVFFAPLYVGNKCINDCSYCGYRSSNASLERKTLSFAELRDEVSMLEAKGHKRLILVYTYSTLIPSRRKIMFAERGDHKIIWRYDYEKTFGIYYSRMERRPE